MITDRKMAAGDETIADVELQGQQAIQGQQAAKSCDIKKQESVNDNQAIFTINKE